MDVVGHLARQILEDSHQYLFPDGAKLLSLLLRGRLRTWIGRRLGRNRVTRADGGTADCRWEHFRIRHERVLRNQFTFGSEDIKLALYGDNGRRVGVDFSAAKVSCEWVGLGLHSMGVRLMGVSPIDIPIDVSLIDMPPINVPLIVRLS